MSEYKLVGQTWVDCVLVNPAGEWICDADTTPEGANLYRDFSCLIDELNRLYHKLAAETARADRAEETLRDFVKRDREDQQWARARGLDHEAIRDIVADLYRGDRSFSKVVEQLRLLAWAAGEADREKLARVRELLKKYDVGFSSRYYEILREVFDDLTRALGDRPR